MKAVLAIALCLATTAISHPPINVPIQKLPAADGSMVSLAEFTATWQSPRAVRLELSRGEGDNCKLVYAMEADYEDGTPKFYTLKHGKGANKVTIMMCIETVGFIEYAKYKAKFDAWQVDGDSAKYKAALVEISGLLNQSKRTDKVIVAARDIANATVK